jgi:hypothetical protein
MRGVLAALAIALTAPVAAQQPEPLFASSDPIHIVIQAPISTLVHNRSSNLVIPGTLTDQAGHGLPIRLSVRGITRRASDVCQFPPLRLEFTAAPSAASLFAGQKKLKLVTHCRNDPSFQQYVLLEYSAYRMYNLLTPHSFQVRLANIDYKDASGRPVVSRVGYFIEELGDVAKRNGMKPTHAPAQFAMIYLNAEDAARYALFQHMIANHDWSMRAGPTGKDCCHNAELIGPMAGGSVVAIPYDFDFSGFVNAPYATPPDAIAIPSVRQRFYRGYCAHNKQVLAAARQMRELRPQMMAAITSTPGLDPSRASRAIAFLDPFFADISSDVAVNERVLKHCF